MKFKSQDSSPLISVGEHVATIDKVYLGEAEGNGRYNDKTEQLVVVFLAAGKQSTRQQPLTLSLNRCGCSRPG